MSSTLTKSQLAVLRRLEYGGTNAEIGEALHLTEDTIKSHLVHLYKKLGAHDRAHAVAIGFRTGLLGVDTRPTPNQPIGERHVITCPALRPGACTCHHGRQNHRPPNKIGARTP
jgi:DNA-binding CsgD family transcriptional regulator